MFELAERTNYLRAATLELLSPEFALLLLLAGLFMFGTHRRLIDLLVLTLPLTDLIYRVDLAVPLGDAVYRLGGLQPSDIATLLLLVRHRRLYLAVRLPYFILPVFLLSSFSGYLFSSELFSVLYVFRYALVVVAINYLAAAAQEDGVEYYRRLYCKAIVLSVALQVAQLVCWRLGFEQPGVFFLNEFPRVKGTAHEPATFAAMLALSLPFCFGITRSATGVSVKAAPLALGAILVGLALSLSVTGFVIALLLTAFAGILLFQFPIGRRTVLATVLVTIVGALAIRATFPKAYEYTLDKVRAYPQEVLYGSPNDVSGRASDRKMLGAVADYPVIGIGVFNAALVAKYVGLSATNMYFSFLLELGIPLFALFLFWLFALIRSALRHFVPENAMYVAGFLAWIISLAGLRTFGFYLPWVTFAFIVMLCPWPVGGRPPGRVLPPPARR